MSERGSFIYRAGGAFAFQSEPPTFKRGGSNLKTRCLPLLLLVAKMSAAARSELLQVKRLSEFAIIPTRGSAFSAGFDLSSAYDTVVPARGKALVKTDLAVAIPENTYARIAPRSGLALKNFIDTGAGVVDYDYRGPVGVVLFNHGPEDFVIKRGDRIAQLILERICMAEVQETEELFETSRGAGGFGSTGVAATEGDATKKPRVDDEASKP